MKDVGAEGVRRSPVAERIGHAVEGLQRERLVCIKCPAEKKNPPLRCFITSDPQQELRRTTLLQERKIAEAPSETGDDPAEQWHRDAVPPVAFDGLLSSGRAITFAFHSESLDEGFCEPLGTHLPTA